jgi:hypothetical protein
VKREREVQVAGSFFIKERLLARIILSRPGDERPILELEPHSLAPGETLMFKFPEGGIEIKVS